MRESQMAQKVNRNRKEMAAKPSLSCNYEYFKSKKTVGVSTLLEFLTDDDVWEAKQGKLNIN
jgi:hypothetical protein